MSTIFEILTGRPGEVIRALINAKHLDGVRAAVDDLFARHPLEEFRVFASTLGPFLER